MSHSNSSLIRDQRRGSGSEARSVLNLELGAVASLFPAQARASVVVRILLCPTVF